MLICGHFEKVPESFKDGLSVDEELNSYLGEIFFFTEMLF